MKKIELNLFATGKSLQKVLLICRMMIVFAFLSLLTMCITPQTCDTEPCDPQPYDPQVYDTFSVQVINNLIIKNGLKATTNDPESWTGFVVWTQKTPKKIENLYIEQSNLKGSASFAGLKKMIALSCSANELTGLDVTGCEQLSYLFCEYNKLTQLDVTSCPKLGLLHCYNNTLHTLRVKGCVNLNYLHCTSNCLTELDLSGLEKLRDYYARNQNVSLTLYKNKTGEYTFPIFLNNPTFGNTSISYSEGILISKDNTVSSTTFAVQTNLEDRQLSGYMRFTYSDIVKH
ncbi:MAG: hypothetical protein LBI45_02365 [Bacteroidales bacterium]|jgi:hypothetical protein|nr:hypothetical protein [Bacteroidales bacterium]